MPDNNVENNPTAEKIVDTATALWAEKGFEQSTMRELARRMGMGASSLYFYFASKEEIVQYLYRKLNSQAIEEFRAQDKSERNLAANLSRYMKIKLQKLAAHRSCLIALMKETIDPNSSLSPISGDSGDARAQNIDLLKELVARSSTVSPEQVNDTAAALWFANLGVLLYWLHDKSVDYQNTLTLVEKLGNMIGMLPMLSKMPGANTTLRLFAELVHQSDATTTDVPRVEQPKEVLREFDVVVVGGGPIGVVYASFLKLNRPRTKILLLDKYVEPTHKIGESTLSGFCKALRTIGVRKETMQTLFYPKNGLGFFFVEPSVRDIRTAPEYILETFDETYQVERRVLDSLLIANARRLGIEVIQGAAVDVQQSTFDSRGNVVAYSIGSHKLKVRASLVVDASGPAGLLAKHFGLWTTEGIPFQTSAVWGYYRGIRPLGGYTGWPRSAQYARDQYTQHLCMREGWLWYIPIISWQSSPTSNLSLALDACLRPVRSIPTRDKLLSEFGCPSETITSVGMVLRSDRDRWMKDDARAAFEHNRHKYPAIGGILEGAELMVDPYGTGQTFMQRLNFRGYSRQVTGDGWLLVGDAAFFVDPLISPGLTGGTACAYRAAMATINALEEYSFGKEAFTQYEDFVRVLHSALELDNQLVYMSFNHPMALELIQRFQEIDARRHFQDNVALHYGVEDTNVWGILTPSYAELQQQAWQIMRDAELSLAGVPIEEQSPRDYTAMVAKLEELLGAYLQTYEELTPYARINRGANVAAVPTTKK